MKSPKTSVYLFFVFFVSLIFKPDKDLDLSRYYEVVETWTNLNYFQVAMLNIEQHGDFLYFVFLKIFSDLGIPLQLLTAIFATLFYKGALLILNDSYNNGLYSQQSKRMAERAVFFTAPIHLILSIARMTCSFSFAFLAIHMYNKKKYFATIFLLALALCSHSGTTLFLGLFVIILLILRIFDNFKIKINSKRVSFYMIVGGVLIIYVFSFLAIYLERIPYFADHSYYLKYLEEIEPASYRENGFITYITMLFYISINIFYAFKSNLDTKSSYCTCVSCIVPIFYFLGNLFSMRACMFSIPFFSVCVMGAYNSASNKSFISLISGFSFVLFILVLIACNRLYI